MNQQRVSLHLQTSPLVLKLRNISSSSESTVATVTHRDDRIGS